MDNVTMLALLKEMADECRDPNGRAALAKVIDLIECPQVIAWHDDKHAWLTHRAKASGTHALIYAPIGAILPRSGEASRPLQENVSREEFLALREQVKVLSAAVWEREDGRG